MIAVDGGFVVVSIAGPTITVLGGIAVVLIQQHRGRRENAADHALVREALGGLTEAVHAVGERLSDHIDSHHRGDQP